MLTVPLTFSLAPFPTGFQGDANAYSQQLVANLTASFSGNFLIGQTGGSQPSTNIGPWFDGTQWWAWNPQQSIYVPVDSPNRWSTVINGQTQVWQRNTSFAIVTNNTYTADKYVVETTLISGLATVSRNAINLAGSSSYPRTEYSLRITVTTPQATIGGTEYWIVSQRIERQYALSLFDNPTSLSILMQSSVTGTFCVTIRNSDSTQCYTQECVILAANTPTYFSIPNVPAFPTSTGNWGTADSDFCYSITVAATCGSSNQGTAQIWNASAVLATVNQTNLFGTNGNTLDITLIQHEPGIVSTPYNYVPFDIDLLRCQRYYYKTYGYGVYAGQLLNAGRYILSTFTTSTAYATIYWPVILRQAPVFGTSLNIYSGVNGTGVASRVYNLGTTADVAVTSCTANAKGIDQISGSATFTANNFIVAHVTVDVDM